MAVTPSSTPKQESTDGPSTEPGPAPANGDKPKAMLAPKVDTLVKQETTDVVDPAGPQAAAGTVEAADREGKLTEGETVKAEAGDVRMAEVDTAAEAVAPAKSEDQKPASAELSVKAEAEVIESKVEVAEGQKIEPKIEEANEKSGGSEDEVEMSQVPVDTSRPPASSQQPIKAAAEPPAPPAYASSPLKNELKVTEGPQSQAELQIKPVEKQVKFEDDLAKVDDDAKPVAPSTQGVAPAAASDELLEFPSSQAQPEMSQSDKLEPDVKLEEKPADAATILEPTATVDEDVKMGDEEAKPASQAEQAVEVRMAEEGVNASGAKIELGKRKLEEGAEVGGDEKKAKMDVQGAGDGGVVEVIKVDAKAGVGAAKVEEGGPEVKISVTNGLTIATEKVVKDEDKVKVE